MVWKSTRFAQVAIAILGLFLITGQTGKIQDYVLNVIILCGIYMTLAVSLNLINGITGQFSIGHAGFYAVGAYVGATWTKIIQPRIVDNYLTEFGTMLGDTTNFIIALLMGAVAAGIVGFIVGLPSLRLRGDYLAIVTLGFGEVIRVVLINTDAVGGPRGLSGISATVSRHNMAFFWVFLVALCCIVVCRNLVSTVRGLTFLAVREDEIAADAMGVNTTRVKVTAFVIGSAFAGAAGVLYSHFYTGISPDVFDMNTSILITTMVVLGGTGSITGSIFAAILLTSLPEILRPLAEYRYLIFSTTLVVMMLTRPQGIFGHRELTWNSFRLNKRQNKGKQPA